MTKPILYSARVCPFCQRCRLALSEKNVDFDLVEINLRDKPAWFSEVSPFGTVPALRHGDLKIWESAVINEYLEEAFPAPLLLPTDPGRRAQARIWIDFAGSRFAPLFYRLLREQVPDRWESHREKITEVFKFMEVEGMARLSGPGPFWLGPEVSLVDLAFYPWIERWPVLEHYRQTFLPNDFPTLARWWSALAARPSAREDAQSKEFYIENYRAYAEGRRQPSSSIPAGGGGKAFQPRKEHFFRSVE